MDKPMRRSRLPFLALSGGGLTVVGAFLPWTVDMSTATPLVSRGVDTTLGALIVALGVAMLGTALMRGAGARLLLLVLGWSGAFWMVAAYLLDRSRIVTLTFGPGWYCSWAGIGLTLMLTMGMPLWKQLQQRWTQP